VFASRPLEIAMYVLQPSFMVDDDLRAGTLVDPMPEYWAHELGVHAVYPSRKHLLPKVRLLIDYLAGALERQRRGEAACALIALPIPLDPLPECLCTRCVFVCDFYTRGMARQVPFHRTAFTTRASAARHVVTRSRAGLQSTPAHS
jgi:hypothetical protein